MNKLQSAIIVGLSLALVALWFHSDRQAECITDLNKKLSVAEKNSETLQKKLEREHNDKLEISKRNEELEVAAKADTSFDWRANIASSDVVLKLKQNAELLIQRR